jgi:hypothetical protein
VYGKTEAEVVKKKRQSLAALDGGTYTEPSRMTVGQWLDVWVAEYLDSVKPATLESYRAKAHNNIKPLLGSVKLQGLKPHHVQTFCNMLHREKNLSPKSVKCIHGILQAALRQAGKNGCILVNPADGTNLPR